MFYISHDIESTLYPLPLPEDPCELEELIQDIHYIKAISILNNTDEIEQRGFKILFFPIHLFQPIKKIIRDCKQEDIITMCLWNENLLYAQIKNDDCFVAEGIPDSLATNLPKS